MFGKILKKDKNEELEKVLEKKQIDFTISKELSQNDLKS